RASRANAPRRRRSTRSGLVPRSARRDPLLSSRRGEDGALLADALLQLVERVAELLHAFALERVGHVVVVDAGLAEVVEELARLVQSLLEGVCDDAVILEGLDRLLRHRVHGVGAD